MGEAFKRRAGRLFIAGLSLTPWILAMYGFFWLDASGTWTADTPHRGKMSVGLLASGMAVSFWAYSRFGRGK